MISWLAVKQPTRLPQKDMRMVTQEQEEIAVMHRHPAGKRGVTPGHPRPCVSTICRTKLRDIHALAALLRFWVVNACLPQDNARLCTLHRVRLAWEVCLQKFKLSLSVVVQFSSHKRPQQGRGELKNRLKMVGYDRDCSSTCPKKYSWCSSQFRGWLG